MTIENALKQINLSSTQEFQTKIDKYIKELLLFNSAYDLINADNYDDVLTKHILDSLNAVEELQNLISTLNKPEAEIKFADAGSGGGLPGIPLAAYFSNIQFTLIERMSKRCAFLENCCAIMGLKNVTVLNKEIEKAPKNNFDIVVFRAFRPLDPKMTKSLLSLLNNNGFLAAYKAKKDKIDLEMNGIKDLVKSYECKKLESAFLDTEKEIHQRHLVIFN